MIDSLRPTGLTYQDLSFDHMPLAGEEEVEV